MIYLLFGGAYYYPAGGAGDLVDDFDETTDEDAVARAGAWWEANHKTHALDWAHLTVVDDGSLRIVKEYEGG